jgi:hypothetical protein
MVLVLVLLMVRGEWGDQRCGAGRRKRKREKERETWWREKQGGYSVDCHAGCHLGENRSGIPPRG